MNDDAEDADTDDADGTGGDADIGQFGESLAR